MLGRVGELNAFRHNISSVQRVYWDITHGKRRIICTQKTLPPATIDLQGPHPSSQENAVGQRCFSEAGELGLSSKGALRPQDVHV